MSSSQCKSDWCGVACFGLIGPYFFEGNAADRYVEMLHNFLKPELGCSGIISVPYGSNKMGQLPKRRGHQWMWYEKCFHSTLFHGTVMFSGLHVHLIYPCVITFFGGVP
jgi:hypothetical protein